MHMIATPKLIRKMFVFLSLFMCHNVKPLSHMHKSSAFVTLNIEMTTLMVQYSSVSLETVNFFLNIYPCGVKFPLDQQNKAFSTKSLNKLGSLPANI